MIKSPPAVFTFSGISLTEVAAWSLEKKASRVYFDIEQISNAINYQRLPRRFINVETWPHSSNLKCWHCDIVIGNIAPKFIPIDPCGNMQCDAYGAFNTWGCAVAYVDYTFTGSKRSDSRNLISMYARLIDKITEIIQPAPPKTLMSQYCGESGLTPEEYLDKIQH